MRKLLVAVLAIAFASSLRAQGTAVLKGQVTDNSGAVIPGATVSLTDPRGTTRTAQTDAMGAYTFAGLQPGRYTIRAASTGFGKFERAIDVGTSAAQRFDIGLKVALEKQEVTVTADTGPSVSTEAANNAGAIVLRNEDLDSLSDDPDDLAADLQALAGPSAGPNGGEIYVDGFSNGQLPPKSSIREVRINQNPFSAEYDRLGFGRIEILTKPGTDRFRGQVYFNDGDAIFNSRNPFVPNQPDFQSRQFGGNLSGPLGKKASFFLDTERREIDDNAIINATVLDPTSLEPSLFREAVVTPQRRTSITPRIDYQLTPKNTLVGRYSYMRSDQEDTGVGQFSLLSRAYGTLTTQQLLQLTETAMVSSRAVNETRFQFSRTGTNLNGSNSQPAINVLDAFNGGGAQVGQASTVENRWELQNYTTMTAGAHGLKFGIRVRALTLADVSPQNFGGTFTFSGGFAPELDASNQVVLDSQGNPVMTQITSIERYRRTLLLQQLGYAPAEIRKFGGGASQFSIAAGNPAASLNQIDLAPFAQDDWRVRQNLTLSLGVRYETQTNIHDWRDIAPRIGFAWAPGAKGSQRGKTVLRGGFGMFYDRIAETLTLSALRFNGVNQEQYLVTNPDFFPVVPPVSQLQAIAAPQTIYRLASNLRAPYVIQSAIGIERQLPFNTTIASTFTWSRADHLLLTRNINAPLPGTYIPGQPDSGVRPYGPGNIYEYDSAGILHQKQWITNINSRLNKNINFFGFYVLSKAMSNTDGVNTFPANPYDLTDEWGRSSLDVRHRFVLGGSLLTKYGFRFSPFVIVHSGQPFNITTGRDLNGDTVFSDRPAFATDPNKPGVIMTPYGLLDPNPGPGETLVPRNFGESPGFVAVNLRFSKTFGFGPSRAERSGGPMADGGGPHGGGRGPGAMRMGGGGMGGMFGDSLSNRRFNLTLSAQARNIINHTNPGAVVGNLSSPLFGQSTNIAGGWGPAATAGNRRIELGLRLSF